MAGSFGWHAEFKFWKSRLECTSETISWTVARYNTNVICWHTLHTSPQSPRHHAWIRNILKVSMKEVNFGFENMENLSVCSASLKKLCMAGRALGVQYQASNDIVAMFRIVYETLRRYQRSSKRIWQIDIYHSTLSNLENYGDGANWLKQTDGRTDNLMFGGLNQCWDRTREFKKTRSSIIDHGRNRRDRYLSRSWSSF